MFETVLIIIFTLVFGYIAWWRLSWAVTLVVLFLPSYLIRFEILSIPMTILELMILIAFIVWLYRVFSKKNSFIDNCQSIWWPSKWLTIIFILVGIMAVIISPDLRQALGLWKAYILEPLLFFIVFVNVIRTKEQKYYIFWALGSLAVLIGFGAFLQYIGLAEIPSPYGLEMPPRATSIFPFPTAIGKLVGPIVALFAGILLMTGWHKEKNLWEFIKNNIFISGVLLFGFIGLFFSLSRGALIGVLASLIFVSFFSKWKKWIWLALFGVIVIALLISPVRNNILGVFDASDVSTDVRLVMWRGAVRIIQDNILTGTGLASFPIVYEDYKEASHVEFFPNPDHFILSIWIEMGLAGLVIFIGLIIKYFQKAKLLLKKHRVYAVSLMAAMIAILVHGFFDTSYFKNDLAVQFWIFFGLVLVLNKDETVINKIKNKFKEGGELK